MPNRLSYWERRSAAISRAIAVLGLLGLIAVTLVTIVDVLLRWLFSAPIDGLNEVLHLLYAVILTSFFPTALVDKSHLSIRFLGAWLGPRMTHWLDAFGAFLTTLFFIVVGWQFIVLTQEFFANHETTWVLAWPVAPWWGVTTALLLLCVPVQLVMLFSQIANTEN